MIVSYVISVRCDPPPLLFNYSDEAQIVYAWGEVH